MIVSLYFLNSKDSLIELKSSVFYKSHLGPLGGKHFFFKRNLEKKVAQLEADIAALKA